ncbi:MAG: sugar phosphate isomerase/epimerase [Bacteroidales bacterium]|nr:sugar phosphate isomerase/epimerase [Bacteroidales bacterium]
MKTLQNRREFLKISAAGAFGMMVFSPLSCKSVPVIDRKSFGVGLQLYTVRNAMGLETDVPADKLATLKRISDLGYRYLELADYSSSTGLFYGYSAQELKKIVSDLGMEIVSSHTQVEAAGITVENAQKMADDHAELGVKYCVQPWIEEVDRNIETYKKMAADWNQVGEIMKNTGIQFGYHNHNFEFADIDGVVPYYDIFMAELDPELVTMEIDMYWVTKAGQDPVEMIQKYPGRFQLFHLKDMYTREKPVFEVNDMTKAAIAPVGAGVIDFKRILEYKDVAGMKFMFVEDDNQGYSEAADAEGIPPIEQTFNGLETSITNLTTDILVEEVAV